jgi:hypothetical protein
MDVKRKLSILLAMISVLSESHRLPMGGPLGDGGLC